MRLNGHKKIQIRVLPCEFPMTHKATPTAQRQKARVPEGHLTGT